MIEEFLKDRFEALARGDYAAVYNSYAADAPLLGQFADIDEYVDFARNNLSRIQVVDWSCVDQRQLAEDRVECLLAMELSVDGASQYFYESALLIRGGDGWRYHSAQKLGADDFSGTPEQIRFDHFDKAMEKIRF
ncbi:MAG: hypothetical protein C0622_09275 [Desulfuromonas sp.]|nr:MAG: hypothetical protein C0622_09275 [Desulfuromonas sp.]